MTTATPISDDDLPQKHEPIDDSDAEDIRRSHCVMREKPGSVYLCGKNAVARIAGQPVCVVHAMRLMGKSGEDIVKEIWTGRPD